MWVTPESLREFMAAERAQESVEYHHREPWGTCVLCRVSQFLTALDDRSQCKDRKWCETHRGPT